MDNPDGYLIVHFNQKIRYWQPDRTCFPIFSVTPDVLDRIGVWNGPVSGFLRIWTFGVIRKRNRECHPTRPDADPWFRSGLSVRIW